MVFGASLAIGLSAINPQRADAQVSTFQALPKGMVGLGFVGVEVGLIVPAIAGARDWWPYLVFPVLGGAGGAVGGYFLDQATANQPEISVTILAVSMALLVPTVIGTLALTAYRPPSEAQAADEDMRYEQQGEGVDATQDDGGTSTDAVRDEGSGESASTGLERRLAALTRGGAGLLRFDRGQLLLALPLVSSRATFTAEEIERLGLQQRAEMEIPLVSATF